MLGSGTSGVKFCLYQTSALEQQLRSAFEPYADKRLIRTKVSRLIGQIPVSPDSESVQTQTSDLRVTPNNIFVTTTVERGATGALIANYIGHCTQSEQTMRPCELEVWETDVTAGNDEQIPYAIEASNDPSRQLSVLEAARATSAAPGYFEPLESHNGREYWDGGLFYNNPAKIAMSEYRRLWPESSMKHPDLLLSIGSGTAPRLAK